MIEKSNEHLKLVAGGERRPSGVPIAAKPVAEAPGDKCPLKRHQDGGVAVFIESAFVSFQARKLFYKLVKFRLIGRRMFGLWFLCQK